MPDPAAPSPVPYRTFPSTTAQVFACRQVDSLALCNTGSVSEMALRPLPPVSLQCRPCPRPQQQSFLAPPLSTALSAGNSSRALPWPISLTLPLKQAAGKPPRCGSLPRAEDSPASAGPAHSKDGNCPLDRVPRVLLSQPSLPPFYPCGLGAWALRFRGSTPRETLLLGVRGLFFQPLDPIREAAPSPPASLGSVPASQSCSPRPGGIPVPGTVLGSLPPQSSQTGSSPREVVTSSSLP